MPPARPRVAFEDAILYVFAFAFMIIFCVLFQSIRKGDQTNAERIPQAVTNWQPASGDAREVLYYKAQLALSALRYQQSAYGTIGISARRNFGFLIGSLIALLGCVVAIRGTRAVVEATLPRNAKISTTSAGAFIIFIGGAIIMATLLGEDRVRVNDDGIDFGPPAYASGTRPDDGGTVSDDSQRAIAAAWDDDAKGTH